MGDDKNAARKLWVKLFVSDIPADTAAPGTVNELLERYERDFLPHLQGSTKDDRTRYCETLKNEFGNRRYAGIRQGRGGGRVPAHARPHRSICAQEAKRRVFDKAGRLIARRSARRR